MHQPVLDASLGNVVGDLPHYRVHTLSHALAIVGRLLQTGPIGWPVRGQRGGGGINAKREEPVKFGMEWLQAEVAG